MRWTSGPATTPSIVPSSTEPSTLPSTQAATEPVLLPVTPAATLPTTYPFIIPATQAATEPTTVPTAQATTQVTTQATTQATTEATTEPVIPPTADVPPETDSHQLQADAALAEQLAGIAELEFVNKVPDNNAWPLIWRHQAALLSSCATLNPTEARYSRLIADAMVQLHDSKGELEALGRAINANSNDEFSWNRDLDLRLSPMQTAAEKVKYLREVIGNSAIPGNVRAHAGYRLTQVLLQRGEDDGATAALAEALRNCPASVECLMLRYQLLPPTTPRFERCEQLLDLLHANPLQLEYSEELANLIADAGLVQESLPWFQLAVSTAHLQGDPGKNSMLNWAAELYIGDEKLDALRLNSALLQIDPSYAPAHFLQLLMTRAAGNKDEYTKALQQASNALSNRIVEAVNLAAPKTATKATTRPINDSSPLQLPDLSVTTALLNQPSASPQVKQQFAEAVADMAMLEGYFAEQPETAGKLIDALKDVVPSDAPELARLRGWNDLLAKKSDDAKAKFSGIAAQDPLAELGLIKVMLDNPADRTTAESMGRRLLQDHPSGLLGALLWEQLHGARVKLITTTQADALREAVSQFPLGLLRLVDRPQSFYAIHVEPAAEHVGTHVGEPLLAQVSVQNLSDYDLTIGPDGVLKPELLFTIHPKVGKESTFAAFDTLAGPTVLGSHSRIDQVVRIDQTQLLAFLTEQANSQFEIAGSMDSNRTVGKLGGYSVQFVKSFLRLSSALTPANEQAALADLANGRPEQKIEALTLIERFAHQLEQTKHPGMQVEQEVVGLVSAVHHARVDPLHAVSAWAAQCEYNIVGPDERANIIRDMAEASDWRQRQLSLLLINGVEASLRDQIISKLLLDPQSSVRAEANAVKAFMASPPSTQPTTAPTTVPTITP